MAVYVDDAKGPYGRMYMSHMIADSHEELVSMARQIGLRDGWLQYKGQYKEHFDVCQAKRRQAIAAGAIEVTQRELAAMIRAKRVALPVT